MKILETQAAILPNAEVLAHLQKVHKRYMTQIDGKPNPEYPLKEIKDPKTGEKKVVLGRLNGLRLVVEDLTRYLTHKDSPIAQENATYPPSCYRALVQRLKGYELTKSEMLMIFNLRPKDAMALDVIIEECDSRFDENQQQAILDAVGDVLGHDDEADGDGDGADAENAGGDMSVDA